MALAPDVETYLQGVPWPRSNVLNVNEDDPVERYFDLHAYYGSDDNLSLGRSDTSSSSSVLTPGLVSDATSPSVHSDSSSAVDVPLETEQLPQARGSRRGGGSTRKTLEDARMQDGNIIWPQTDPGQRLPRDSTLRLPPAAAAAVPAAANGNKKKSSTRRSPGSSSSSSSPHSSSSSSPSSTRSAGAASSSTSRHVKNPAETAQVRKVGACIKCRIEKLKCSEGGICHSCEHKYGTPLCERTCLRKTLVEAAKHTTPVRYTGMSWEQEQHLLKTRCAQGRGFRQVYLTFSESGDLQAPHLQAIFQQCRSVDKATEGMEVWAFPRERVPSHEQLIGWAEGQIRYERDNGLSFGFESSVEFFLMMYSKADSTLPQFGLLKKIHHLGCMYRIWRMDELFCRTSDSPHVHAIPDMISAELRQIVRKALESLERDILAELDKFLKPSGIPSKARAQMWAGLWQLIFVFKGLTKTFHEAGDPIDAHPDFYVCRMATEEVLVAVLSFYGSHYRQASNLQVGLDCSGFSSKKMWHSLNDAFQRARLDRGAFHADILASEEYLDTLIRILVVDHEVKRLGRKRNRNRAQPHEMAVYDSDYIDDEVMTMEY